MCTSCANDIGESKSGPSNEYLYPGRCQRREMIIQEQHAEKLALASRSRTGILIRQSRLLFVFFEGPSLQCPCCSGVLFCFFFFFAPAGLVRASPPLLTPQVGWPLVVYHARGQRAVVRRRAAEQDVVGHGLVQHGAVRAGVGALAVAAHALV